MVTKTYRVYEVWVGVQKSVRSFEVHQKIRSGRGAFYRRVYGGHYGATYKGCKAWIRQQNPGKKIKVWQRKGYRLIEASGR